MRVPTTTSAPRPKTAVTVKDLRPATTSPRGGVTERTGSTFVITFNGSLVK